ncbi:hypothetical protein [Xanthovirga aplysinae]|uniref:hypothetical protein n=1 Tax=Xanthovirga aplysinae TaxID=2529853 RepID=UPI0012BD3B00|nr:hypothetical protein [Xanthovirga aplysinae]MTI31445.1 hypothetical protein [Xanthovirga aplysinae]
MPSDIFYFNPTCELAVADGGRGFQPPGVLQAFERNLETLPIFLSEKDDIVLVSQLPHQKFLDRLISAGFQPPQLIELSKALKQPNTLLRDIENIRPWGWSPAVHRLLQPIKNVASINFKEGLMARWEEKHRKLYARMSSLEILSHIISTKPNQGYLPKEHLPQECHSEKEIHLCLEKWKPMVLKAPWSSSGRGILLLKKKEIDFKQLKWIKTILKRQGSIMAEPWLNKVADLALVFQILPSGKIHSEGFSRFLTNSNGQYQGAILGDPLKELPKELRTFLNKSSLDKLTSDILKALENSPYQENYRGLLGVDVLVYKNEQDEFQIHPCVEINCRTPMGLLSIRLSEHLHDSSNGYWKIFRNLKESFENFDQQMQIKYPLTIKKGLIYSGYLPLVEPGKDKHFGAYMVVQPSLLR